jgi:hypothetical protein
MTIRHRTLLTGLLAVLAGASTALVGPPGVAAAQARDMTTIVSGLDNPRGLAFDRNGRLIVGEAGHAGPLCVGPGELGPECIGLTSRISRVNVSNGKRTTVVDGLPSVGTAVASTGVDGVATVGRRIFGIVTASPFALPEDPCDHLVAATATATVTASVTASCPKVLGAANRLLGDLIVVDRGHVRSVADVGTYDYAWVVAHKAELGATANPDFMPGDANPYAIAPTTGGMYVVDAGANTLGFADPYGNVRVLKTDDGKPVYFPDPPGAPDQRFPYDAVPTCVIASGSNVYVGSLSGSLWRYDGHTVTLVADRSDGLTALNGCDMAEDGSIIASNIFGLGDALFTPSSGSIVRITPAGAVTTLASGVNFPGGVAVDGRSAYVVVNSVCPKSLSLVGPTDPPWCTQTGSIVRLPL